MTALRIIPVVLGGVAIAATLLPFIRSGRWWIRVLDFPRVQIALLAILSLAGLFGFGRIDTVGEWALVGVITLSLAYQLAEIWPYTPLAPKQVLDADAAPRPTLSLVLANVLMTNRRYADFLDRVRDCRPDIVVAVEPDTGWEHALAALERDYPYTLKRPADNAYGMLLYSKKPLARPEIRYLIQDDVPSMHLQVALDGRPVALHFVHPRPPAPQENDESTERDAELVVVGREVAREPWPAIVAGDLNDVAWSHTTRLFQRVSRLLDPRIGRGMYNTFHARYPLFRWPLDHVFHSDHFTLKKLARLPSFGSDHFAMFVELALTPEQQDAQEAPALEPEHAVEAEEKVAQARDRQE